MAAHPPARRAERDWIDWPFFDDAHRALADTARPLHRLRGARRRRSRRRRRLVPQARARARRGRPAGSRRSRRADGDATDIDSRSACLARETLAWRDGLADFAFAMQGLGSGAIAIAGSPEFEAAGAAESAHGRMAGRFRALREGGRLRRRRDGLRGAARGRHYVIDGEKTWISNGGIADVYTLFARTGEAPGAKGLSAFVVFPDDPGFSIAERIEVIAPHPLATLRFDNCRIPASAAARRPGEGFKIAMRTLDIFRASVAAAALGFARRALDEAIDTCASAGPCSAATLADLQLTQATLGEMATEIDAAALLTYRAAWRRDVQKLPTTREAAMAKMTATENGAARDRPRGADVRRARRQARRDRREPLSRDPGAAHLRRRDRGAEADRRARIAEVAIEPAAVISNRAAASGRPREVGHCYFHITALRRWMPACAGMR